MTATARDRLKASGSPPHPRAAARPGRDLRRRVLRALPFAIILAGAAAGSFALGDLLGFETLSAHREALIAARDANYLLAVCAFMAAYVAIVAFSLPGATVATLTGGFLFDLFPGVLYNVTAATIGASVIFLAARWGFGERLAARMAASEGTVRRVKEGIDENQWSMLFLIRLVPVVPFFLANLIPAMVGVPLGRFVISTFLGIIPGGLVYTSVGAGLGELFDRGEVPELDIVFTAPVLLPMLGLAGLAALPLALRFVRGRRAGGHGTGEDTRA